MQGIDPGAAETGDPEETFQQQAAGKEEGQDPGGAGDNGDHGVAQQMFPVHHNGRRAFCHGGPQILPVDLIQKDSSIKPHAAAGAADDPDDDGQNKIFCTAPAPDGEPVPVVPQQPLSGNDECQITDAHSGDGKDHDHPVDPSPPPDTCDHGKDDPQKQFTEEDRQHEHQGGEHAVPEFFPDGFPGRQGPAEIKKFDIWRFAFECNDLFQGCQELAVKRVF